MNGENVVTTKQETIENLVKAWKLCSESIAYYEKMLSIYHRSNDEYTFVEIEVCKDKMKNEKIKAEAIYQAIYCLEHNVVR